MGGYDQSDLYRDLSRDIVMVTDFWYESAKIGNTVCWHSTTDGRIATWMHALTPLVISLRPVKI